MNIHWDAKGYAKGFDFVPQYGEAVMDLLTVPVGSRVIDLGCGNGRLTKRLKARGYDVTGVDASPDMLALARETVPDVRFVEGDAVTFSLEPADAIFSNAVLHWIDADRQQDMLKNIAANLKPGGELVCEFGGYGCAEKVHAALRQCFAARGKEYAFRFYFPTIGEYAPMLERAGLLVKTALLFDRPTPQQEGLAGWIRMFNRHPFAQAGLSESEMDEIIREAEDMLRDELFMDGVWIVDYVRIRIRAEKMR